LCDLIIVFRYYTDEPIVSSDIIGIDYSSIFDSLSTLVIGNLVKVFFYSCQTFKKKIFSVRLSRGMIMSGDIRVVWWI
jgi:hypothetical protein